jgi:hypothetical protein
LEHLENITFKSAQYVCSFHVHLLFETKSTPPHPTPPNPEHITTQRKTTQRELSIEVSIS